MTIFDLDRFVLSQYQRFARSFADIRADDLRTQVDAIYASGRFWPEPMIQLNPKFAQGESVASLVRAGELAPGCEQIFKNKHPPVNAADQSLMLHKHQLDALMLATRRKSYVVTTGTGSGKSLCYFLPIVDRILRGAAAKMRRTRAIVIYPMNALANSQLKEINQRLEGSPFEGRINVALYTGQQDDEERTRIRQEPPDILLTNFMMLELLLTRKDERDQAILANCRGLEFLVLDELHTYRGRQGADVAMLVRRVRERLELPERPIQCIGTSATMASDTGSAGVAKVAKVASTLFATEITSESIVTETLDRRTDPALSPRNMAPAKLRAAVLGFDPAQALDQERLKSDPFMVWIELTLGLVEQPGDPRPVRATPLDLADAATRLAEAAGLDQAVARGKLTLALATAGQAMGGEGRRPFLPVRLHRFIAGAGRLFATLEPPGQRSITFDEQGFMPGRAARTRLFGTYFCRSCGQEHHPVRLIREHQGQAFHPRDIDDMAGDEDGERIEPGWDSADSQAGFITPITYDDADAFNGEISDYPEDWQEEGPGGVIRLKRNYRKGQLVRHRVAVDGSIGGAGQAIWFQPGRYRFCPACRDVRSAGRDINRLAGLTAEGRSSATTILIGATLHGMKSYAGGDQQPLPKVLGFSDNRQDAALQAGHFNDFVFVARLRGAVLAALDAAGPNGLVDSTVGRRLAAALGFDSANQVRCQEWLAEPELEGLAREDAAADLAAVLTHRFWYDQRRGWRYSFPNLEQSRLVQVDYAGLPVLCADATRFGGALSPLFGVPPEVREHAFRILLDGARTGLAVRTDALARDRLERLIRRRHSLLQPWGFADEEAPIDAGMLVIGRLDTASLRDAARLVRTGSQSAIGKALRKLLGGHIDRAAYDALLEAMADTLIRRGLLAELQLPSPKAEARAFQLVADQLVFRRDNAEHAGRNPFYCSLYNTIAAELAAGGDLWFGDEAREHTAQVEKDLRQIRELRFRWGKEEQKTLAGRRAELRQHGEPFRFLPVMFCSPTMELGVDIAELDTVYLRNVPPSPANYAQRSGRAGRSGAAALVLTYCAAQSPHDQYFFERRADMIKGEVRPPTIDLANQDLIESHLRAVWLAELNVPLSGQIAELLELNRPGQPLRPDIEAAVAAPDLAARACTQMIRVLTRLVESYREVLPPWFDTVESVAERVTAGAADDFRLAFARWRGLLSAAEAQRDEARRIIDNHGIRDRKLQQTAEQLQRMAQTQINALRATGASGDGDFYTYRYLATEGFLPGYNFPRLPVMAYIPGPEGRSRRNYVQRPRFLAISEFGPFSLIYHEGRAYRVDRAQLPASELAQGGGRLLTVPVWLCSACGASHAAQPERCHACGANDHWRAIQDVRRIDNLATRPAAHITANDEERRRQGFEIITTFAWAARREQTQVVGQDGRPLLSITYAPAAKLQRLNLGLRRRENPEERQGFLIEPSTGRWLSEHRQREDMLRGQPQLVVPMVEDSKNALLLRPAEPFGSGEAKLDDQSKLDQRIQSAAVLQYALLRGIEIEFQLEEGEILSEPMPSRDERSAILFYEASEGGAGVLARIAREPEALARVAAHALGIMHFQSAGDGWSFDQLEDTHQQSCVDACYRCLLSYFNQPDHEHLQRHDGAARDLLCRLTTARAMPCASDDTSPTHLPEYRGMTIERLLDVIRCHELPQPKVKASGDGWQVIWPQHLVVLLCGPTVVDRRTLEDADLRLLDLPEDEASWPSIIAQIQSLMREVA